MNELTPWQRFLTAGEYLVTRERAYFSLAVEFVEALACPDGSNPLTDIVQSALGCELPPDDSAPDALTTKQMVDVLILADPTLVDVPGIDDLVAAMSDDDRELAMTWACAHSAAALEGTENWPTLPECIGALYALLISPKDDEI